MYQLSRNHGNFPFSTNYPLRNFKLINTNSKHSWNVINSILGRKKENRNITLRDKGDMIQNPLEIAEMFNERFSAVSRKIPNINTELQYNGQIVYECIYLDTVSSAEVYNIICELESNKAAGSDGIPCKIIKALKDKLADSLVCIINKIISEACYPDILKLATVVPVYKKGDSQDPKNYRPISLLPIVNKIFEKIILNKILDFMDTMEIKDTEQYGYKKSLGTSDAILKFCHNISSYLDSGDYCIAIFMDLSSAFDTLNREVLLKKLSYLGIKGHASSLLESYFDNRRQSVRISGVLSNEVVIDSGVAQGSLIGPTFFNVCQFDSPKISSNRLKYADDNVIYKKLN